MRMGLAFKAFFRILSDNQVAEQVEQVLRGDGAATKPAELSPAASAPPAVSALPPKRSEALTLLATLQREARLVDLVQEPLEQYSDSQVGAAAREVLRDCAHVLERLFDLQPVVPESEGAIVETPTTVDVGRYRLSGHVAGQGPFLGTLVHPGWEARHCRLPQWQGSADSAMIVSPAEVEVSQQTDPA